MALITLSGIRKSFGAFQALDEVSFTVGASEKVALVGPNGSGKTTILRIISGEETPDSGSLAVLPRTTIGVMRQESELPGEGSVVEEVSAASGEVRRLEHELRSLESAVAEARGSDLDELLARYAEVQLEFERRGGYAFEAEVKAALGGLGLGPEHWDKPVRVLSGGQKTRAALARLLLQKPDVLLLDEPTNHLDIEACEWLEGFLPAFPGAVLIVSHDRYFLDRVVTKVVDLHGGVTRSYPGNYTAFARQKSEALKRQTEDYERQRQEIEKVEEFIRRNKAGQNAKQARGREKILSRLERLERPKAAGRKMALKIESARSSSRIVLETRMLAKSYGARRLFASLDLTLEAGDRLGVVGPNGSGKTTFLRVILGQETPSAGQFEMGYGVETGYFAQGLDTLDDENTVLDELLDAADLKPAEARNTLAGFLFRGDDVFKSVSALSGGERNRLSLCKLIQSRPNLLVLDEPTNHLDIDAREALGEALAAYDGTIILTSHDRYLLNSIASRILEISGGQARLHAGNYDAYAERARALKPRPPRRKPKPPPQNTPPKRKGPSAAQIEKEIESAEARHQELTELLSDPDLYADHERSAAALTEHTELARRIEELYAAWEEASEAAR